MGLVRRTLTERRQTPLDGRVGLKIGNYVLERPLGRGRMGAVYLARDEALLRKTAVKVLCWDLRDTAGQNPLEWFLDEARHVASINHPRVVQIYSVGKQGENCYIAMEFVDGPSAESLVHKEGPLSLERATRILIDTASALQAAHDAGVIHRDVKPANILVSLTEERAKLGDFGMALSARTMQEGKGHLRAGTPYYTAPENWQGAVATVRSDLYALGATYYYLLTGRPPYPAASMDEARELHLVADLPDPREVRPEIPPIAVSLIRRAMAKAPHQRFDSAKSLESEARALLRELNLRGHVDGVSLLSGSAGRSAARGFRNPDLLLAQLGFIHEPFSDVDPLALPYTGEPFKTVVSTIESRVGETPVTFALLGPRGSGRSTLIDSIVGALRTTHSVWLFEQSAHAVSGHFTRQLGLAIGSSQTSLDSVLDRLSRLCDDLGTDQGFPIIVIDELSLATLTELGKVAALARRRRTFGILLCASSEVAEHALNIAEEHIRLEPLSFERTSDYIDGWMNACRNASDAPVLVSPDARRIVAERSQGIVSRINTICKNALVLTAAMNRRVVTSFEAWHAPDDKMLFSKDASILDTLPERPVSWPSEEIRHVIQDLRRRMPVLGSRSQDRSRS